MSKGFLARTSFDISPEMSQSQSRQQTLSSALKLRLKWQDLCIQCGSAVSENGMRHLTSDQDRALSIIIRTYDLQIRDLEYTAADGKYLESCTRSLWHLVSFHNGIDQKALCQEAIASGCRHASIVVQRLHISLDMLPSPRKALCIPAVIHSTRESWAKELLCLNQHYLG